MNQIFKRDITFNSMIMITDVHLMTNLRLIVEACQQTKAPTLASESSCVQLFSLGCQDTLILPLPWLAIYSWKQNISGRMEKHVCISEVTLHNYIQSDKVTVSHCWVSKLSSGQFVFVGARVCCGHISVLVGEAVLSHGHGRPPCMVRLLSLGIISVSDIWSRRWMLAYGWVRWATFSSILQLYKCWCATPSCLKCHHWRLCNQSFWILAPKRIMMLQVFFYTNGIFLQ